MSSAVEQIKDGLRTASWKMGRAARVTKHSHAQNVRRPVDRRHELERAVYQADSVSRVDKGMQLMLSLKYKEMHERGLKLPALDDIEFRTFSQNGEDGILHYVFSLVGVTNKRSVELCAGDGIQCNTANLIINHGWEGLLFDGSEANVEAGRQFYRQCQATALWPPKFSRAWVTRDNVNELILAEGFGGELDLFSLDLDGNDYWIWEALDCIDPRVVILEFQNAWGPKDSKTIRYQDDFVWRPVRYSLPSSGASLAAFTKLGRKKGYRLVGCQRYCFNAVFLREDVGQDIFPEVSVEACLQHSLPKFRIQSRLDHPQAMAEIQNLWVDV